MAAGHKRITRRAEIERRRPPAMQGRLALASLVVGLNLFTEGLARILGRTVRLGER